MALWPEEPRTVGNQGLSPLISPFTRERHFGRKKRWSLISFTGIAERLLSSCLSHKKKIHFSEYFDSVSGKFIVIYLDTCIFFFCHFTWYVYIVCLCSSQYMPVAKLIISEVINLKIGLYMTCLKFLTRMLSLNIHQQII